MRISKKQESGVTRHPLQVTGCPDLESAPEDAQAVHQAAVDGAERIGGMWEAIDKRRAAIADVPSAELTSGHYGEMSAIREAVVSAMVAELDYREVKLDEWHAVLSSVCGDLQEQYYKAWEAAQSRVRKGLEKLGYDMGDPRQAGAVLFHPEVKGAKIQMDSMRGSTFVQNARAANQAAIESLQDQLDCLRNAAMRV